MSKINDKIKYIYLNGKIVKENKALVSIQDRGFRFGDGCFETIRVENGVIYQLEVHLKRLQEGLSAIKISYNTQLLKEIFARLLHKNKLKRGFLRVSITRGEGSRGYLPEIKKGPTIVVEAMGEIPEITASVDLWVSNYRKISEKCLPSSAKTMQGLNSSLARMEAQENGCFEALMLGDEEKICEGSSSNIFWMQDGKLYTPSLKSGVLPGIMRNVVKRISPLEVVEGIFCLDDLKNADEVFLTNVAWLIAQVKEIKPLGLKFKVSGYSGGIKDLILKDIKNLCA